MKCPNCGVELAENLEVVAEPVVKVAEIAEVSEVANSAEPVATPSDDQEVAA